SSLIDAELSCLSDPRERALAQELSYGVLRWLPRLQALLQCLLHKPLKMKDADIQALLLLGLYQLLYLRIPDYAATAATVNVARGLQKEWATRLINAVLRNCQRQREKLLATLDDNVSTRLAHPVWILEQLQTDWPKDWESLAQANNVQPLLTLRVNQRYLSRATYLEHLHAAGIVAVPTPYTESGITLAQPVGSGGVMQLPGFSQGWASVQDGAAQLVAPLLDVPEGARVLDACAAPGGKTAHILERYTVGHLLALDNEPARVQLLKNTLGRLQLSATVRCSDARQPATWWDGQPFARILLDTPCSGSGVIRRHPDIKYLRQATDIPALAAYQRELLENLWSVLAPQGQLLYVTCSVFAEENHRLLEDFLANQRDAQEVPLIVPWGHALPVGRQILPSDEPGFDGFYYACLTKIG
ncbi:MAG: 16S rRNA (cytosine(967)-C(5))-methyltransferase, partial [Beggiatoa sp. IS2]